jgi:hypothetical protein
MTNSVKEYLDLCKDGTVVTQPWRVLRMVVKNLTSETTA